ncbi:hypothetical protein KI387_006582, partial [Taxus chinensis]
LSWRELSGWRSVFDGPARDRLEQFHWVRSKEWIGAWRRWEKEWEDHQLRDQRSHHGDQIE